MLFLSDRAVIPKSLQETILKELHISHLGITKMKQLARRYVYWEGLDKDIEHLVKSCESCAKVRHSPQKAPIHAWNLPDGNWEKVHLDYAGPFNGHFFLMCVDAKSKWAVHMIQDAPSSFSTLTLLEGIVERGEWNISNIQCADSSCHKCSSRTQCRDIKKKTQSCCSA